jgi:hypothetical protein
LPSMLVAPRCRSVPVVCVRLFICLEYKVEPNKLSKDRLSPEEKAEVLGQRLLVSVDEAASLISFQIAEQCPAGLSDANVLQFLIELFVFYMLFLDRLALECLDCDESNRFECHLVAVVSDGIITALNKGLSSAEFATCLKRTYDRRQAEYQNLNPTFPAEGEPLNDTLFWALIKIIFALTPGTGPAKLMFLITMLSKCNWVVLNELRAEETLRNA